MGFRVEGLGVYIVGVMSCSPPCGRRFTEGRLSRVSSSGQWVEPVEVVILNPT